MAYRTRHGLTQANFQSFCVIGRREGRTPEEHKAELLVLREQRKEQGREHRGSQRGEQRGEHRGDGDESRGGSEGGRRDER
jgi:hypothetical protein